MRRAGGIGGGEARIRRAAIPALKSAAADDAKEPAMNRADLTEKILDIKRERNDG